MIAQGSSHSTGVFDPSCMAASVTSLRRAHFIVNESDVPKETAWYAADASEPRQKILFSQQRGGWVTGQAVAMLSLSERKGGPSPD